MSVIIHGMDMPDGCHHCRFSYLDKGETNDGEPCSVIMCSAMEQGTNRAEYDGNRPSWCPLVPLPEGHGRLIDGTDLYTILDGGFDVDLDELPDTKDALLCMIQSAETIVPAEGGTEDDDPSD